MTTIELTRKQIKFLNSSFSSVNEKKDWIQDFACSLISFHKSLIANLMTGFGKSLLAIRTIQRIRKLSNQDIVIVVPSDVLMQQWKALLKKHNLEENVHVYIINSYVKLSNTAVVRKGVFLVVDEAHFALGEDSVYFSKLLEISDFKFRLLLSATLLPEHLALAESFGFNHRLLLNIPTGIQLKIVPPYKIYNVAITLSNVEKFQYIELQKEYDDVVSSIRAVGLGSRAPLVLASLFNKKILRIGDLAFSGDGWIQYIATTLGISEGVVRGLGVKYMKARNARKKFFYENKSKAKAVEEILSRIPNERTIVACGNIESISWINDANAVTYHSKIPKKQRDKNMEQFLSGEVSHLIGVKSVVTGVDSDSVTVGINEGFNSIPLTAMQFIGRTLRHDPNNLEKVPIFISTFIDDFEYDGEFYESQEKKWLKRAMQGVGNMQTIPYKDFNLWKKN